MDPFLNMPAPDSLNSLDAWERQIEEQALLTPNFLDPVGDLLDAVEASIEYPIQPLSPVSEDVQLPESGHTLEDSACASTSHPMETDSGPPAAGEISGGVPVHHGLIPPWLVTRRVGRRLGLAGSDPGAASAGLVRCPLIDDLVDEEAICEECQYYDESPDTEPGERCRYWEEEEDSS